MGLAGACREYNVENNKTAFVVDSVYCVLELLVCYRAITTLLRVYADVISMLTVQDGIDRQRRRLWIAGVEEALDWFLALLLRRPFLLAAAAATRPGATLTTATATCRRSAATATSAR